MMQIDAKGLHFSDLNRWVKEKSHVDMTLINVTGQRYIGSGTGGKTIKIHGTPGNALGAYLDGSTIEVFGNAQDATGDTMNHGEIIIHGNTGDAAGYAMRGGRIFVRGSTGYRTGIHMKAYQEHKPVVVIGEKAGNFLGEYQAGGLIIVLGLGCESVPIGTYCGTGMHGGKMFIRCDEAPTGLPVQVNLAKATAEDLEEIKPHVVDFCRYFGINQEDVWDKGFYILTPNTKNPYKQLYTHN